MSNTSCFVHTNHRTAHAQGVLFCKKEGDASETKRSPQVSTSSSGSNECHLRLKLSGGTSRAESQAWQGPGMGPTRIPSGWQKQFGRFFLVGLLKNSLKEKKQATHWVSGNMQPATTMCRDALSAFGKRAGFFQGFIDFRRLLCGARQRHGKTTRKGSKKLMRPFCDPTSGSEGHWRFTQASYLCS